MAHTAKAIQDEISRTASMNLPRTAEQKKSDSNMSHVSVTIIAAAATILILGIIGVFWLMQNPLKGMLGGGSMTLPSTEATEWTGDTIKNYMGMTFEDAVKSAENDNAIHIVRSYADEYSDEYKEGTVMAQNPPAGARVTQQDKESGVYVSLTVSRGKQMRELPDIEGQTLDKASQMIAAQGLLGTAEYAYNDKYAEGIVVGYREKSKGETVEYGTNVIVIVSKGKEPVTAESDDE